MHIYSYTFLEHFPLPENLSALLTSLRRQNSALARQLERGPQALSNLAEQAQAQSLNALRQLGQDDSLEYASDFSDLLDVPLDAQVFLHICEPFLPAGASLNKEKGQALGLALSAYQDGLAQGIDPLLLIPCAVLDLICLSPLPKHSHLAALPVSRLLLCRSGFTVCQYVSLEHVICRYYFFYQRALSRAKAHWAENGCDYLPFMEIFLSMLYLCFRRLPAYPQRGGKRAAIESFVLSREAPISKAEICAALPNVSQTTVEAALGAMVKAGVIRKVGAARSARYIKNLYSQPANTI